MYSDVLFLWMANLDTLFLFSVHSKLGFVLSLNFFATIKAFVLVKNSVLYFSFSFTTVLTSPILKELYILFWDKSLFLNLDTFKKYWLIQNTFSNLKVLSWDLGPTLCVLEARSNSKIARIKTKGIVIYHHGNNGYCGKS